LLIGVNTLLFSHSLWSTGRISQVHPYVDEAELGIRLELVVRLVELMLQPAMVRRLMTVGARLLLERLMQGSRKRVHGVIHL